MAQQPSTEPVETLIAKSQALMIEFLQNDLALAFTFLGMAEMHKDSDPAHCRENISKAKRAVDTIRKFEGRIENPEAWSEIHERGNQLETAIRRFENGEVDESEIAS